VVSPDFRDVGSRRDGLGHNRRLFPGRSGPPTLAPGDQLEMPIALASMPIVTPGISHDDARLPPREHGRIRRLQPRSECGSAITQSEQRLLRIVSGRDGVGIPPFAVSSLNADLSASELPGVVSIRLQSAASFPGANPQFSALAAATVAGIAEWRNPRPDASCPPVAGDHMYP